MDRSLRIILEKENKFCIAQKINMTPRFVSLKDRKLTSSNMICVSINFPGIDKTDKLYPACIILSKIIGLGSESRLFKQLRSVDRLCYSTSANCYAGVTGEYLFSLYANVMLNDLERCVRSIYCVLKDVLEKGISEEELEICKIQYKRSMVLSTNGEESHGSFVFRTTSDNYTLEPKFLISDSIMEVTSADVMNALVRTLEKAPFIAVSGDKDKISTYTEKFEEFKSMFVELVPSYKKADIKYEQSEISTGNDCNVKKENNYSVVEKINLKKNGSAIEGSDSQILQ